MSESICWGKIAACSLPDVTTAGRPSHSSRVVTCFPQRRPLIDLCFRRALSYYHCSYTISIGRPALFFRHLLLDALTQNQTLGLDSFISYSHTLTRMSARSLVLAAVALGASSVSAQVQGAQTNQFSIGKFFDLPLKT